jgi:hypothetical protein
VSKRERETNLERTTIYPNQAAARAGRRHRTGVSLHGHTSDSREQLNFLGAFRHQFPLIPAVLGIAARQHRRRTGERLDITRAGWRPPLGPEDALRVESDQIRGLGLLPIVSLTDHDEISANLSLGGSAAAVEAPVSVEWTVPFGRTFFHLGVHNLPRRRLDTVWNALRDCTRRPDAGRIADTLVLVSEQDESLIVLNHPLWDEGAAGAEAHRLELQSLLRRMGAWIHAVELNGLRSRAENDAARQLASEWRKPLISGGDRHGAEPNAAINLSNARTFAEFASEVRRDRHSEILLLPQYYEPLRLRWLVTVWDIVKSYPQAREGRRHWGDRFFYRCEDGVERSVTEVWRTSQPPFLTQVLNMLWIAESPRLRPALRLVLADQRG